MANNISIVGRLAADSEKKFTPSGASVLEFRIADDVGFGEKKVTNWWRCALWGKQSEGSLVDYLKKGQQVIVFGEATMREWTDKEGVKKLSPEIRVNSVQLAGKKAESDDGGFSDPPARGQESRSSAPAKRPQYQDDDSEIPF